MKKKWLFLVIIVLEMFVFTGCAKTADEKQIKTDLEAYTGAAALTEDEKISGVTIDKRQTEKKEKTDTVWCTIQTEDERCSYEKGFILTYTLYDEGGWMLDEVSVSDRREWEIQPLVGADVDEIEASIIGIDVMADNESWHISQNNIKSISIDSQETDLETQKDIVTVTVTIDDLVEEASGQLIISYRFNQGSWVMDSMSGRENFSTAAKPGKELNVTEDNLIAAIDGQVFKYSSPAQRYRPQEITIHKDAVTDFVIDKQEGSSKGVFRQYICKCTLKKSNASFALTIEIPYYYTDQWNIQPVSVAAECTSVDIVGKWTGINMYGHSCELNIAEVDENGNISGTYRGSLGKYNGEESYSYYVTGQMDRATLEMTLYAGEMIGEKPFSSFEPDDITAKINVEDSLISGNEGIYSFKLTRQ